MIPTRNRLEKLQRALASVEQQTFRDYEVLLVDDGSTDGTREYLESGRLQQSFPCIGPVQLMFNPAPASAAAARNLALQRASGEFIAFLDDDDVWLPGYLHFQVGRLQQDPAIGASCARHVSCDARGAARTPGFAPVFEYEQPLVYLLAESFVHSMSVLVCRRSVLDTVGLLDEQWRIVHDWDWYARMLMAGCTISPPAGPVLVKRDEPGGLVGDYREWYAEEMRLLTRIFGQSPVASAERRQIRTHRELFFARVAWGAKDYLFSLHRLIRAFLQSPPRAVNIIRIRGGRYLRSKDTIE